MNQDQGWETRCTANSSTAERVGIILGAMAFACLIAFVVWLGLQ